MKFGAVPVAEAAGGIVAHAIKQGDLILKKGSVVRAGDIERLAAAGIREIAVAALEAGDVTEDDAARRIAEASAGGGVKVAPPFTGRANLFAEAAGVLVIAAEAIHRVNRIDDAITIATLANLKAVTAGEMVATVKIIPFAVAGALASEAVEFARAAIRVAPFMPKTLSVISTMLPGLKPSVIDKTLRVLAERIKPGASVIAVDKRIAHELLPLAEALRAEAAGRSDIIVVFGASAITDRRDVIPAAIEHAGGRIEHLGMPVDPGNLLLIGGINGKPVIGAPGCARSPNENGFDWVLQRLQADLAVTADDIRGMGVGGLLMEIVSRPQPRAPGHALGGLRAAAIILAAGRALRMGSNKLSESYQGKPLVRHAAEAALASQAQPVIVVTGNEPEAVKAALAGLSVTFAHNPDFASGLASSLRRGIAAVPETSAGAIIMLGDMPKVTGAVIDRLLSAFSGKPDAPAVVPAIAGMRGNPVLLSRRLFKEIDALTGDAGARRLIEAAGDAVIEIAVDDPAIAFDVDTPEALARLRAGEPGGT